ncbi:MAG: aldehyde dehydrogenase family protein [Eubacteriales bacterium]|nr:aldehyde dehydrogenase family protein [Eubacteriales bacterium]
MKMIIGNKSVSASDNETIQVTNPYDGSFIDTIPHATREDVDMAVQHAVTAQKSWKKVPVHQKADLAMAFLELVRENKEDLAQTLTLESGKNITEARNEINNIFTAWRAFCEKAKHLYGNIIPAGMEKGHDKNIVLTKREPVGVVACIIPFNFPCNLFNQKVAPALLSGNTAIIKPASDNPLTVCKLTELLRSAGFPAGVVQVVTGYGSTTGNYLCSHEDVNVISLTGSTDVGISVAVSAARSLKKAALELSGNDAFIVLEDADLELAVREAVRARFYNAGQICCAPKRFLIHKSLYSRFLQEAVKYASALQNGNPLDEKTQVGTLINERAAAEVEKQVALTIRQGSRLLLGGKRSGAFMEPSILADVPFDADIMHNMEVFGPVMPVTSFETDDEAIALANDSVFGLGAGVFTKDLGKSARFTSELECGSVVINGSSYLRSFEIPFGGWKRSGLGTEGVFSTFEEFTKIKCIALKEIISF